MSSSVIYIPLILLTDDLPIGMYCFLCGGHSSTGPMFGGRVTVRRFFGCFLFFVFSCSFFMSVSISVLELRLLAKSNSEFSRLSPSIMFKFVLLSVSILLFSSRIKNSCSAHLASSMGSLLPFLSRVRLLFSERSCCLPV